MKWLTLFAIAFFAGGQLHAQTIAEKKAGIGVPREDLSEEMKSLLNKINSEITDLQRELQLIYKRAYRMYREQAPEEAYLPLLNRASQKRDRIRALQEQWQQMVVSTAREASYALWNQPDTTIGQLVNDFGSYSYLYVTPPEISSIRISLDSNLPIPRSSWDEVLEFLLHQSGIGVRQLNPYLRELYFLNQDLSDIKVMTAKREDLEFFPPNQRVIFVLFPDSSEIKRIWYFLDKFVNSNTTALQMIGREILIVGRTAEIQDLLKIYDFVSTHRGDKEYKAIQVRKVDVEEMAKILSALFESITEEEVESKGTFPGQAEGGAERAGPEGRFEPTPASRTGQQVYGSSSLKVIPLLDIARAIFLVGTKEEIRKAEEIVQQVEAQVGETRRKEIVWYRVKHSDPEELAQILYKIYNLMIITGTGAEEELPETPLSDTEQRALRNAQIRNEVIEGVAALPKIPLGVVNDTGFLSSANYLVHPEDIRAPKPPPNQGRDNFLVDPKTSSLVMVIEEDLVTEMKNLIKRLDVPKRMVHIEVMLVEQVFENNEDIGLNLLRIGSLAKNCDSTSFLFNDRPTEAVPPGITDFLISRAAHGGIPAFDIAYHFLISRDDVRITSAPSVLTLNETEANFEFEEEISVSVGTFIVPNAGTATLEQSFARARYGISINVIPTIHLHDEQDEEECGGAIDYITLDSDIKFETIASNINNLPRVIRRTLKNQARIADGQTVIIGGFRRKDTQDASTHIPFLGEIPGFGKLFSNTVMRDRSIETFLFLTAKIASEPIADLENIKMEEMARRPGDLPYFMKALRDARDEEQNRFLYHTMNLLFGREPERFIDKEACEINGRCGN